MLGFDTVRDAESVTSTNDHTVMEFVDMGSLEELIFNPNTTSLISFR